jgi:hypothetical protein
MLPNGAVGEKFVAFDEDLTEGREVKRIKDLKACRQLPGKEE